MIDIIKPFALVIWAIWQVLQSVDQKIYWIILIFSILFYLFYRLTPESASDGLSQQPDLNASLEVMSYWRNVILFTGDEIDRDNVLKRDLGNVLAALYALKYPGTASFEIYAALKQRRYPLPERIYSFLFPVEPPGSVNQLKKVLHSIWRAPKKWVRRWTRQDVADYHRSIEEAIDFLESSLEEK